MVAGANEVYYGPYLLSQRAVTALEQFGVENPDDLDNFKMMELRGIPGFGTKACAAVRSYRDFRKFQDGGAPVIDLSMSEPKEPPPPPPQINICLQVTKEGTFRLRHYEWVQNMLQNFTDPGSGNPLKTESDFIAYLIQVFYKADATKGGTRGIPTGGAVMDGQGNAVPKMNYSPTVSLT